MKTPTSANKLLSISRDSKFVGKPNVLDRDMFITYVQQILDSGIHTNNGPFVRGLESYVKEALGVKHCLAVANATLGLELVLQSFSVSGEVIVPSFTFAATVHAIVRAGLIPIFSEVDSRGQIDCSYLESLINEKTCGIVPVNTYGFTCDLERLETIAKSNRLFLIYDSAHGLGVKHNNRYLGGCGDAEIFSLHATKFISGFEGGLITTNSDEIAKRISLARNFGFIDSDTVAYIGTNAKMSEVHAAMALTNMQYMEEIIEHNKEIYLTYKNAIVEPLTLLDPNPDESSNYQYVVVICPSESREYLLSNLWKQDILARRYFSPGVHKMGPYRGSKLVLPVTEKLAETVLCLPNGLAISKEDAKNISTILNDAFAQFEASEIAFA
jgi:dTDP-4-amino-4,6-dideoxygalactose transaminase